MVKPLVLCQPIKFEKQKNRGDYPKFLLCAPTEVPYVNVSKARKGMGQKKCGK